MLQQAAWSIRLRLIDGCEVLMQTATRLSLLLGYCRIGVLGAGIKVEFFKSI